MDIEAREDLSNIAYRFSLYTDPMSDGAGRPVPPPRPLLRWLRQQADGRGGLQRGGRASGAGLHSQQGRAPQARELRQASKVYGKPNCL